MSVTVAQRPHIHLPWKSIAIILGAALVAAVVLVLVNQPWEAETGTQSATTATSGQAVVVPKPEPWSMMHARPGVDVLRAVAMAAGASAASEGGRPASAVLHNRVQGTTLDGGAYVAEPAAPRYPSGTLKKRHPLNFTTSGTR